MFEHLDDPAGFTPTDAFRRQVAQRARRWHRRSIATRSALSVMAVGAVIGGAIAVRADRQLNRVERVDVAGLSTAPPAGDPYTVLMVGADGNSAALSDASPTVPNSRTDVIILARIEPAVNRVTLLPLPRDLRVDAAGIGPERINNLVLQGGPDLLIATLGSDLGIEVNRYLSVDLGGAVAIGDAVGGLRLDFAHPMRDRMAGFNVTHAGCTTLDARGVLGLARSRHLEVLRSDGTWLTDGTGDLGRIERQSMILAATLETLNHLRLSDPGGSDRMVDAVAQNLTLDAATSRSEMFDMFRDVAGAEIRQLGLPVRTVVSGTNEGPVMLDRADGSEAVLAAFTSGAEAPAGGPVDPAVSVTEAVIPVPC